MKILVAVRQVSSLDDEDALGPDGSVDADALEDDLNEWDAAAVEAGLQAGGAGVELVAVTVGDEDARAALVTCVARGATRGIRIWDASLDEADPLVVAQILHRVIERERPELVLCGVQTSDALGGATGAALAGLAGLPIAAVVRSFALSGDVVEAERELDGGATERLSLPLPALLTIQTGGYEPRYANLRAIKQAERSEFEILTLSDLGLDAAAVVSAAGSRRRWLRHPELTGGAAMVSGSPGEVASAIADIIRGKLAS